jgi:glycerophosphoryl diester phosphodiesterase
MHLRRPALALSALTIATVLPLSQPATATSADYDRPRAAASAPLVLGHRGASGYRPEHTLASYELAARMGADYIEPDLVSTKDRVLVARHENEISGTTNVADHPEFADRRTTKTIDGLPVTGWFTEDFTLAELKTLRAKERLPQVRQENTIYDGRFEVPTLAEVLRLRERLSAELHREIGVYPETKHPTYFRSIGLPLERPLIRELDRAGLNRRNAPVFVQSFEPGNLVLMNTVLGLRTRTVFLTSATGAPYDTVAAGHPIPYSTLVQPAGLRVLKQGGIDGLGPDKNQVIPRRADDTLGTPTSLVRDAHAAGLTVHPYTFRAENQFLPADYRIGTNPNDFGRAIDEQVTFLRTGIDGLFTDQPDIGVVARDEFLGRGQQRAAA